LLSVQKTSAIPVEVADLRIFIRGYYLSFFNFRMPGYAKESTPVH
jgi:hypothetical protein